MSPHTCQNDHHQKINKIISVGEDWEKRESPALLVQMRMGTMENWMEIPQKIQTRTTIQPSNSTSGYLSEKMKH